MFAHAASGGKVGGETIGAQAGHPGGRLGRHWGGGFGLKGSDSKGIGGTVAGCTMVRGRGEAERAPELGI